MSDEPDPADDPQAIHRPAARIVSNSKVNPAAPAELSTTDEPTVGQRSTAGSNLASEALASARSITAAGGRRTSGRFRRRRGSSDGAGGYSGAGPDGRDPMPLGKLVDESITALGWVGPLAEARLLGHWSSVVGSDIAARCQPVSLLDGELKIAAESTAWATQLRLMAPQLLARICREMPAGTVRKLLISGPSAPSWKRGPWSMHGGRGVRDTYG